MSFGQKIDGREVTVGSSIYRYDANNDAWRRIGGIKAVEDNPKKVKKSKLKKHLKKIGKWKFIKRIKESDPVYIDDWDNSDEIDVEDSIMAIVAKGLGVDKDTIFQAAKDEDEVVIPLETAPDLLAEAQRVANALVSGERDRRKYLPITYETNLYSVSEWDITMINALLQDSREDEAILPIGDYWKTMNNNVVRLRNKDLEKINKKIREQIQDAYQWSWTKKAEIAQAASVAQVNAINLEVTAE